LLGCGKHQAIHIVILPDVSGSIDRESLQQAFKAIDELAGHFQRGDRLTIIPILGDAQAEAPGQIIRFEIPQERRVYDADLRKFRTKLRTSLGQLKSRAFEHPGMRTDILGSIALAEQEFSYSNPGSSKLLAILSDFVQEDENLNFRVDVRLKSPANVQQFARSVATSVHLQQLRGVSVYLGLLKSREYSAMDFSRREAIKTFWIEYLSSNGAQSLLLMVLASLLPKSIASNVPCTLFLNPLTPPRGTLTSNSNLLEWNKPYAMNDLQRISTDQLLDRCWLSKKDRYAWRKF
jgi:hypothetical protein